MAINRADILSRTFEIPQPEAPAVARGGTGGGSAPKYDSDYFGIPEPAEGLQWTDNVSELSNRYYQKLSALDQFAKSMWLNNKIDVTRPDYSNPQGVLAAQAYQQELANIMSLADELKTSQKDLTAARAKDNFVMNPGAFGEGQSFANAIDQGYSTEVAPVLQFQEKGINRNVETTTDYNRLQNEAAQAVAYWQDRYNQTGSPQDLIQLQAAQSMSPTFNPPAPQSDYGGFNQAYGSFSEIANTLRGRHRSFQGTNRTKNGATIFESFSNPLVQAGIASRVDSYVDEKGEPVVEIIPKDPNRPAIIVDQQNGDALMAEASTALGYLKEYKDLKNKALSAGKGQMVSTEMGEIPVVPLTSLTTEEGNNYFQTNILPLADNRKMFSELKDKVKQDILDLKIPGKVASLLPTWAGGSSAKPQIIYNSNPQSKLGNKKVKVTLKESSKGGLYYDVSILDAAGGIGKDAEGNPYANTKLTTPEDVIDFLQTKAGVVDALLSQAKSLKNEQTTEQPSPVNQPQQSEQGKTITVTDRQMKAIEAFRKQFNREPSDSEVQKIISKY